MCWGRACEGSGVRAQGQLSWGPTWHAFPPSLLHSPTSAVATAGPGGSRSFPAPWPLDFLRLGWPHLSTHRNNRAGGCHGAQEGPESHTQPLPPSSSENSGPTSSC